MPVAKYLIAKGFDVKGSTRSPERLTNLQENDVQPFLVDLAKSDFGLASFFDSDILIINIPFKGVSEYSALIEIIKNKKITHVIFISSTSVYTNKTGVITEADLGYLKPCALLEIENLLTSNENFRTTIIRFGGLIGYSRNPALFFKNNRSVKSPESTVNMIHRDDCVNIIELIIKNKVWGEIYNCCADTHPTKREFYSYVATMSGLPVPVFSNYNDFSNKEISNKKVKKDLNYHFVYPNLLNLKYLEKN